MPPVLDIPIHKKECKARKIDDRDGVVFHVDHPALVFFRNGTVFGTQFAILTPGQDNFFRAVAPNVTTDYAVYDLTDLASSADFDRYGPIPPGKP